MNNFTLKHRVDGSGRYILRWNGVPSEDGKGYYYNYWCTFDSREDALEHYEYMVKPFWSAETKWEVVDLQGESKLPTE